MNLSSAIEQAKLGHRINHPHISNYFHLVWNKEKGELWTTNGFPFKEQIKENILEGWEVVWPQYGWSWAFKQMREGNKVCRKGWTHPQFVYLDDELIADHSGRCYNVTKTDYEGRDWMLFSPSELHNFDWAQKQMDAGHQVRRKHWGSTNHTWQKRDGQIRETITSELVDLNQPNWNLDKTDWEVYSESEFNIAWAARQMEAGKKVRRKSWVNKKYYYHDYDGEIYNSYGDIVELDYPGLKGTDWELYED